MIVVIAGERKMYVKFAHEKLEKVSDYEKELRTTSCVITKEGSDERHEFLGYGAVKCYHKDFFNKEVGRQKALARALEDTEFTKEVRTIFWENYRTWGKQRF